MIEAIESAERKDERSVTVINQARLPSADSPALLLQFTSSSSSVFDHKISPGFAGGCAYDEKKI